MMLGAVYEQDFHDFSHGFREGHSPHQAVHELWEQCMELNIGWIVDADVSGFFDSLDHGLLRDVIRKRVNDGSLLRYIGKWLHAGDLEGKASPTPRRALRRAACVLPLQSCKLFFQGSDHPGVARLGTPLGLDHAQLPPA